MPSLWVPPTWTILHHDGPNHLGLWFNGRRTCSVVRSWRSSIVAEAAELGPPALQIRMLPAFKPQSKAIRAFVLGGSRHLLRGL